MRSRLRLLGRYWRFHVAFLALVVLVGGELSLAYQTTARHLANDAAVERTQHVINLATEAAAALLDMESGYRGYLLTGQVAMLEPYAASRGVYQADLQQLTEFAGQDPSQAARWQRIGQLAADWQQQVAEPTIARRRALGNAPGALDAIAASLAAQDATPRRRELRDVFAEAVATERARLAAQQQEANLADARLLSVLVWGTLGAAVLSLVLGGCALVYFERERLMGVRLAIQTAEHELYNRLTAASGNVQLLQRDPTLSARQRQWAGRARTGIEGAITVVRQMRELPGLRETVWREARATTLRLHG